MPDHPTYPFPPVSSRAVLATMLQCTIEELTAVEACADHLYREVRKIKKDGTYRTCYDAKPSLKAMQGRIQCLILKKVKYPIYVMGGLEDRDSPRDYVRNANTHAGAHVLVNEDVASFFPSTSDRIIFDIWRHLFHFPADVAKTLTRLTTRNGQLPQGAKTSSYLANLVFWASEPKIVSNLRAMGFEYSRYIDDFTVSSSTDKTPAEVEQAISLLASMVRRYGLRFKRAKHSITYAGQRMEVTGLVLAQNSAGLRQARRSNIRALVHLCEMDRSDQQLFRRTASLVGQYARLHPTKGQALKSRLAAIKVAKSLAAST